jgi:cbb3-type cytochrome oxidase subunit 3
VRIELEPLTLLALTAAEWLLLVVAIGPVVLVGIIIWIFWRAARRADAEEAAEREAAASRQRGGG